MNNTYFTAAQKEVLKNANKTFNFLCGAVRSGKTFGSYFLIPKRIKQHWDNNVFFVGKTLTTLNRNIFEPMRAIYGTDRVSRIVDKQEISVFGKKCWVVGANDDRAVTKIQGPSAGYFYCDEIVTYPENFFQMMLSRLDKPGSMCDATCNPESPSHYVKQFIDKPENQKYIYQRKFTIYDNTKLPQDVITRLEDLYRGTIYFEKWILGNWVRTEGLVFPLFKRDKHFVTPNAFAAAGNDIKRIRAVIVGGDGATTNDATALVPLAIFDDGSSAVLDIFFHDPKTNGQLSNAELVVHIGRWYDDLINKYRLNDLNIRRYPVQLYTAIDCSAADLVVTMRKNLPANYTITSMTKKSIQQTTDIVNNAFGLNAVSIFDLGGIYNYVRGRWETRLNPLVEQLETMIWDEDNEHFDDSVPNDVADAFRYAVATYYNNPENLWDTPRLKV